MPGHAKKATKKFEKNHLRHTIERRKEFAKVKQRHQQKEKRKARIARDNAKVSHDQQESAIKKAKTIETGTPKPFGDMSVDEFFQGGFELPESESGIKSKKRPAEEGQSSVKSKKAKREAEQKHEESIPTMERGAEDSDKDISSDEEDALEAHQGDLDALAEKDPEFYNYLKENDAELLDFGEDEGDDLGQLSDGVKSPQKANSTETGKAVKSNEGAEDEGTEIDLATVKKWDSALSEAHSLRAMREVVLAFKAAAYVNSDDTKPQKYSVSNPEVYHQLLIVALQHIPTVLSHHLPAKETSSSKVRIASDSKKFRTLTPVLKSYTASLQHLLEALSDSPTIKLTISSLIQLLPYILSFKKSLRALCKQCVNVWSDHSIEEAGRVTAFMFIRRLAVIGDPSIREAVLKTAYQGLVKSSRTTNIHTLSGINLMKNSAAELWGLDADTGYTTGFTYIRQLAIHLRQTVNHPTSDSYKIIYNWQYVHALDFWSRVLSTHCSPATRPHLKTALASPLHPLIYPLVQITLGALRLIPTPVYFPLRFHLTRALLRISHATTTFIPLAASLLEVLNSPECSKRNPKPSTLAPLDFFVVLRAPKSYLGTRVYQDCLGSELSELTAEFFNIWGKHIAFPELALPPIVMLKRWLKSASTVSSSKSANGIKGAGKGKHHRSGNTKIHGAIALLVQKLELNSSFIEGKRRDVKFGPTDREEVDAFLRDLPWEDTPLGSFVAGERKRKAHREKLLKESKRNDDKARRGQDRVEKEENDDEEEFEEFEEEEDEIEVE
ncbi:MAG: hypothetical protein Q9191_004707 [Dirinaria sp. TL-2023a]